MASVFSAWTQATGAADFGRRHAFAGVVANGKMFILGGMNTVPGVMLNDVWSSSDGAQWTQVAPAIKLPSFYNPAAVVLNSRMYFVGGMTTDMALTGISTFYSFAYSCPADDSAAWAHDASLPAVRAGAMAAAVVLNGAPAMVLAGGGYSMSAVPASDVYRFAAGAYVKKEEEEIHSAFHLRSFLLSFQASL